MTSAPRLTGLALLITFTACLDSPYANFGEVLDQAVAISGSTWIATVETAAGPQTRLLVASSADSPTGPVLIHTAVIGIAPIRKLVGTWSVTEDGMLRFAATTEYLLDEESASP
jgi:hypothetical protein